VAPLKHARLSITALCDSAFLGGCGARPKRGQARDYVGPMQVDVPDAALDLRRRRRLRLLSGTVRALPAGSVAVVNPPGVTSSRVHFLAAVVAVDALGHRRYIRDVTLIRTHAPCPATSVTSVPGPASCGRRQPLRADVTLRIIRTPIDAAGPPWLDHKITNSVIIVIL